MRDTNGAIHELIGGGCLHEWDYSNEPESMSCPHCGKVASCYTSELPGPDYEGDISAAMEAVEWLRREKKWDFEMDTVEHQWFCAVEGCNALDESLSKAICAAILAAASGEELVGGQ